MPAVATATGLPSRLGKYELLTPLAAGGMARIYIGRSTGIGAFERHVVLKLITPERANDHTAVQMFLDEARLAASLNHQNVAQVFEVGEDAGIHYLAMEYVHGQDMRALLAKAGSQGTRIPLELALTIVAGAAAGLHHAHERRGPDGIPLGIVHRDVSPSNIMIGYDGSVKLLDFGIAKAAARSVETQSGIIKGKFAYMAPEQCRGRDVDRRSDVFSLGIILYEVSTQHRCFRADSDFDTMHRIVTGDVVRPTRLVQGYPQALEAVVMKALAIDPAQRYQSAGLLLEAIESFAVSAHMPLSTMGLGRFMRDMFGEVTEPWLNRASQPVIQKENTISSTNSSQAQPVATADIEATGVPDDDDARFPDTGGIAGKTILDLPRGPGDSSPEPDSLIQPEWNPRSYPAMPPQLGAAATVDAALHTPQAHPAQPPPGSQPILRAEPQVPSGAFSQTPSSSSGSSPAHSGPIPSTRHGYASGPLAGSEVSYPRYVPPASPAEPLAADLKVKPNRRPLVIGLVVIAIGLVAIFAFRSRGGGGARDEITPPPEGSDQPAQVALPTEPEPNPGSAAPAKPDDVANPADDMIMVKIGSVPPGADVLVAGTKIGVTPLDTKLKRGTKTVPMTVHLASFQDVKSSIDTSGDVTRTFTLKPPDGAGSGDAAPGDGSDASKPPGAAPKPPVAQPEHKTVALPEHKQPEHKQPEHKKTTAPPPPPDHETHDTHKQPPAPPAPPPPPAKPRCQPPNAYDPFDTTCNGAPCPPCK